MSRSWRYREDEPGAVQFITVKGVGSLPVFAVREDVRYFLSLLAREVRAGEVRLYCFAFVRNHAHLLVLSPFGQVHRPLKRILERFARYYNRTRGRTGHVFKDRFHSTRVQTEAYFICCVCYTDHNPVRAGLAVVSTEYAYCSAHHCVQARAPLWLSRSRVVSFVRGADHRLGFATEEDYLRTFGRVDFGLVEELVARRKNVEKGLEDPLDMFFSPDRARRIGWIRSQARIADGTTGARLLARASILKQVLEERVGERDWRRKDPVAAVFPWRTLLVGLLRLGAGRSCRQVESMLGVSPATVLRETDRHRKRLVENRSYLLTAEEVLAEAIRRSFRFLPPFTSVGPDGSSRSGTESEKATPVRDVSEK